MADPPSRRPVAWDLFCGRGGWTKGLLAAGFEVHGVDVESQPDYPGIFHRRDVRELRASDLPHPSVVVASFPCEGFSLVNGARLAGIKPDAEDLELMLHACRLIREADPDFWAMENVRGALMFLNPALGEPRLKGPPFYIWGHFPPFMLGSSKMPPKANHYLKGKRHHKAAALSAEIPAALAEPFARACADALAVVA